MVQQNEKIANGVSFVSSELKCMWMATGSRYVQCDGLAAVGVLRLLD